MLMVPGEHRESQIKVNSSTITHLKFSLPDSSPSISLALSTLNSPTHFLSPQNRSVVILHPVVAGRKQISQWYCCICSSFEDWPFVLHLLAS